MATRRKLEEEIARTKDPNIRKQLQDLLEKREHRLEEKTKTVIEIVSDLLSSESLNEVAKGFWIGLVIMGIGGLLIFIILSLVFGSA